LIVCVFFDFCFLKDAAVDVNDPTIPFGDHGAPGLSCWWSLVGSVCFGEADGVVTDALALGEADCDVGAVVDASVEAGHGGFLGLRVEVGGAAGEEVGEDVGSGGGEVGVTGDVGWEVGKAGLGFDLGIEL
jgi:hypothetical protein